MLLICFAYHILPNFTRQGSAAMTGTRIRMSFPSRLDPRKSFRIDVIFRRLPFPRRHRFPPRSSSPSSSFYTPWRWKKKFGKKSFKNFCLNFPELLTEKTPYSRKPAEEIFILYPKILYYFIKIFFWCNRYHVPYTITKCHHHYQYIIFLLFISYLHKNYANQNTPESSRFTISSKTLDIGK